MTEMYEYVPPADWKTLNALEGFGQNTIPPTDALAGEHLSITFGDVGWEVDFTDGEQLTLAEGGGAATTERYLAREVLDDVFLVDVQRALAPDRTIVLLVDRPRSIVTAILSTVVGEGDDMHVEEEALHGVLPGGDSADRHEPTNDMVGQRWQYIYSPDHAYEHVYLNSSTYCWQCLEGEEKGQADCDPTTAFKIRDDVYLFTWMERVVPCDGIVVIDWVNMRNNGRIFGWDTGDQEFNSISMGARAVRLNVTQYAPLS